jgi:F-type H+-transporting ATPase subunit a
MENFTINMMGPRFKKFAPYFGFVAMYLPVAFVVGVLGLPSPLTYYAVPLILALTTFVFVHVTAIRYQKWGYFKRFVAPFAVFLPINIMTYPVIIVSLSFRMFGNALAGMIIVSMVYWATGGLAEMVLGWVNLPAFNFVGPLITPFFHAYFDFFGAFIQTLVFISLSCLFVAAEGPSEA